MLLKDRTPSLLDRAAEPTLERIVRDQRRASAQVVPILEYILEHLFDYELQVEKLKDDLGIRDAKVLSRFSQDLGESIWEYITARRLEVGARLLRDTDLKVFQIGTSLGYASGDSFSQAFTRRRGSSPTAYRKACAEKAANAERQPELVSGVEIERGMAGELDPGQATLVMRRLDEIRQRFVEVYPHLGPTPLPVPASRPLLGAELVEATMAEAVWRRIEGLPVEEAEAVVRGQVAMSTPALFELLESKVYEIRDRRRAVEIARLAPPSVDAVATNLGEELPAYRARAWTVVGNTRNNAGDPAGAIDAYGVAQAELEVADRDRDWPLRARLDFYQMVMRVSLGRYEEAQKMAEEAVERLGARAEGPVDGLSLTVAWSPEDSKLGEKLCRMLESDSEEDVAA